MSNNVACIAERSACVIRVVDLNTLEQRYLSWAKNRSGLDSAELAARLGVSQRTLYRKLEPLRGA